MDEVENLLVHVHRREAKSKEYLLQKLSIAIQQGNVAAVLRTAERDREQDPFWD